MNHRNILLNSTLLFVIASTLETILHEAAHFGVALYSDAADLSLHHNFVQYESETLEPAQRILIASAGPILSLSLGLVFHILVHRFRKPNLYRLFLLYFSAFGYIGFFGYLMVAPFFSYGDTGFVLRALGVPMAGIIGIALLGVAALAFVMLKLCGEFVSFLPRETYESDPARKKAFNFLIHFPLYLGIVITTLLNLPVPTMLSLIAPLFSPFSLMWGFPALMWKKYTYPPGKGSPPQIDKLSPAWFYLLAFVILINRFLVKGISG